MPNLPTFSKATLLAGLCLCAPAIAGEGLWDVGAQVQGIVDFEPGNDYMTGFSAGYSDYRLMNHALEFQLAYLTSRPEAAFREGVLREDWFLLSPTWHFRRKSLFDPMLQLDFGYQRYDTEFDWAAKLENSTWLWGLKAGLGVNFSGGRYSLRYGFGYEQAFEESSKVYPLPFFLNFSVLLL